MIFLELLYSSYEVGVTLIIISLLSFLWRAYRVKNTIEVDALVLYCDATPNVEGAGYYKTAFKYSVDGQEYIARCYTSPEYAEGTIVSIYCIKNIFTKKYSKATVVDTLSVHLLINIVLIVFGVISICYNLVLLY